MKRQLQPTFLPWRFYSIAAIISVVVIGLVSWMIYLTLIKQNFLRLQGDARVLRVVSTPAFRGMITDRNGSALAISTSVDSVWVNPQEFESSDVHIESLSSWLGIDPHTLKATIDQASAKDKAFIYLKRSLAPEVADQIKHLMIPGIYIQREYRRYYPQGEVAAHLLGFTNVDDQGEEGLELAYNRWLSGTPGKKLVTKDRLGRVVNDVETFQTEKAGNNLTLSIDRRIQYLAYRELMAGVTKNIAESGSVVVLDVKTGEVLAMVNVPSFNPNNKAPDAGGMYRNRAVTDLFEPGSTMKAFSVATALDSGKFKPDDTVQTSPGWYRVGHNTVQDEHNNGVLNLMQILQLSSNVGISKIVLSMPPEKLWSMLHRVGFGEETSSGFPGERTGVLRRYSSSQPFATATLAFGYGISITPLQLAHAYSVIANHGLKLPISLLRRDNPPLGEQVMDRKIADEMVTLLQSVLEKGGTGRNARVPGYKISGKTGTARLVGEHGYEKHHYTSSFVGMAPINDPRFVVAVVMHDPKGKLYYGGDVSGPVFSKVMVGLLRLYNIPPDDPESLQPHPAAAPVPVAKSHKV